LSSRVEKSRLHSILRVDWEMLVSIPHGVEISHRIHQVLDSHQLSEQFPGVTSPLELLRLQNNDST